MRSRWRRGDQEEGARGGNLKRRGGGRACTPIVPEPSPSPLRVSPSSPCERATKNKQKQPKFKSKPTV